MQKPVIRTIGLTKAVVFITVGVLFFSVLQQVFLDKNSYAQYRAWKQQENVDIVVLGNSHAEAAIDTLAMEEDFREAYGKGVSVFNYSLFGMRMEQMYFFAQEILQYHVPDLVVLETYAFCPLADEHRDILARRAFDALPLSLNKIRGINYCIQTDHWSYYIPFIKYHTRWKELSADDMALLYSQELWNAAGHGGTTADNVCRDPQDGWFQQDTDALTQARPLTATQKECFDKLLALFEEKGVQVLLVSVPYKNQMGFNSLEMIKVNQYLLDHYVDGQQVQMLDMNRMWAELDFDYADLMDEGHVNRSGCEKVTNRLLDYLKQTYPIADWVNGEEDSHAL